MAGSVMPSPSPSVQIDGFKVYWGGVSVTCDCTFARRLFNQGDTCYCGHIEMALNARMDKHSLSERLVVPVAWRDAVRGRHEVGGWRVVGVHFLVDRSSDGMIEVSIVDLPDRPVIGYFQEGTVGRADILEMAMPYYIEWGFRQECKSCKAFIKRSWLHSPGGTRLAFELAVQLRECARLREPALLCAACSDLVPRI